MDEQTTHFYEGLVPPRPIPDPIPLEQFQFPWLAVGIVLMGALLVSALVIWQQRRKRRPVPAVATVSEAATKQPPAEPLDPTTLEGAALQIRLWLARRLGPSWLAKTTEVIVQDPELETILDASARNTVSEILMEADSRKFQRPGETAQAANQSPPLRAQQLAQIKASLFPEALSDKP